MIDIDDACVMQMNTSGDIHIINEIVERIKEKSLNPFDLSKAIRANIISRKIGSTTLFRRSYIQSDIRQELWISELKVLGETTAYNYLLPEFKGFNTTDLERVAKMCLLKDPVKQVIQFLNTLGIIVYFIRPLPGSKLDGAVYINSSNRVVIGLTVRFNRFDNFWFTLLHELAHVCIHQTLLIDGIINEEDNINEIEASANRFAKQSIIPLHEYRTCLPKKTLKKNDLIQYSKKMGVSHILLAGLIRNDLGDYSIFSDIVTNATIREYITYE